MRGRNVLAAAALASAAAAFQAEAAETGYDLYEHCISPTDQFGRGYCLGFLGGIFVSDLERCAAPMLSVGQIRMIFVEWAQHHPNLLSLPSTRAAVASFVDAFPCAPDDPKPHVSRIPPAPVNRGPDQLLPSR